ncbi:putative GATA transcription factor (Ams2) [Aspergillus homomorphus CBS 101889]|uniref:GATA transcription factor n=1 Tax=Aspergillus homomorphus (strain CBS 101889) TaxID=1450537 RepID=A0A395I4G0_ASPHC|nr:GATA transcription factor [Aspergillus homomorphus CBS 101889]RAL14626.1 GATA transcription factor [Aspergillus homomorphus CBS 101889]
MESQDGISVRPMRLKVLYTFDDASKTNCLARWPHLLDIQTAALDEKLQIGVIELKTCIQAIVSASPELVAKLGQDYTVYAYDYSEYETPLVGQGMLSWVLASASPTPNAPAHQSKTMVTGRVCKNVLGLFSKGAQETLEVKLRLVPVPTVLQSEYLESMQRYRELSNVIPHEFDAQAWTSFVRQNPGLVSPRDQQPDPIASPMDHAGIERFHRLLSEGSTPREFPSMAANASVRSVSPSQSALGPISRIPTPAQQQEQTQQFQHQQDRLHNDAIRPSSSASMRDSELPRYGSRRGSIQSGYGSCDESSEQQPRKRAKLYRADWPGKSDLNIERQPSSLRVAASTAASVRIHRPTPVNPAIAAAHNSNEEPVRPPTPISNAPDFSRRARPPPSLLRESSLHTPYTSPYPMSDDHPTGDNQSPESRYQGLFEPSFSMPSSPPVLDCGFPNRSSPVLPPMADSGFMSGGMDDLLDEEIGTPLDDSVSAAAARAKRTVRPAVHPSSPITAPPNLENFSASDAPDQPTKERASAPIRAPASNAGSRPSSRASMRQAPKPLAPAPMSQSELEQLISAIPASDPILPSQLNPQNPQAWTGPMSDFNSAETPAPQPVLENGKIRSGAGARRLRQVQARLDRCIQSGQVPPYCENCGAIETPTWRRAWSKEFEGNEDDAKELTKDPTMLFWQAVERDDQEKVTKFKVYKKSLADTDNDFVQVLLCNPCGLWLHKFKCMRPENKWNKTASNKRKRPPRNRKGGGPLSTNNNNPATRHRARADSSKADESSPGASDASSPAVDDPTPRGDNDSNETENNHERENDESQEQPGKRRRANSLEPRKSTDVAGSRWQEQDPAAALREAIQSSPARNARSRNAPAAGENALTPKSVRRVLFPNSHNEAGPLRALGDSSVNSPRRSPRSSRPAEKQPDDKENQTTTNLDALFESPSFGFDVPVSPTPRRRNQRSNLLSEKRLSLPYISPSSKARRGLGGDTSPTKITAQRLQRIQSSPGPMPRQHKTPKQSRSALGDLQLPIDAFGTFEGMDNMIVDIFSDAPSAAATDALFGIEKCASGSNWPDWIPSDYVSPTGSDGEPVNGDSGASGDDPRDLLNALMSDPDLQRNNQFDIFNYVETNVLDSGFFSSDALNSETVTPLGAKDKAVDESPSTKAQPSANDV